MKQLLYLLFFSFLFGCGNQSGNEYAKVLPNDFNFIATWGFDSYKLDTYENELTKMISWENDTVIKFVLTQNQKSNVYAQFIKIDILSYPDTFLPETNVVIDPAVNYSLGIEMEGRSKLIIWNRNVYSNKQNAKRLREVFEYLDDTVMNNLKVKSLPDDTRAYF